MILHLYLWMKIGDFIRQWGETNAYINVFPIGSLLNSEEICIGVILCFSLIYMYIYTC